jgi:hypothetical protein
VPKKLLMGIALLAVAALVVMPALAQATEPHYYKPGLVTRYPEGEKVRFIEWGKLTFAPEPQVGSSSCDFSGGGYVENPVGGGAGVGQTLRLATWNCTNLECPPGEVEIKGKQYEKEFEIIHPPQTFPWPSVLEESAIPVAGTTRTNTKGVVWELACFAHKFTKSDAEGKTPPSSGENEQYPLAGPVKCATDETHLQTPKDENGINLGNNQSKLVFDEGDGKLTCANGAFETKVKASFKIMGFKASELILTKAP